MLDPCNSVVTQLLHHSDDNIAFTAVTVLTLVLHPCESAQKLLLHICGTVVTALLQCCDGRHTRVSDAVPF